MDRYSSHYDGDKYDMYPDKEGKYYKAEDVDALQLELLETREQNARLLKRVEELEEKLKG